MTDKDVRAFVQTMQSGGDAIQQGAETVAAYWGVSVCIDGVAELIPLLASGGVVRYHSDPYRRSDVPRIGFRAAGGWDWD